MPGVYEVRAEGAPSRFYAVALPAGEGDLVAMEEQEKDALSERFDSTFVGDKAALDRAIEDEIGVRDLSAPLLWLALLALVLDLALGATFSGR